MERSGGETTSRTGGGRGSSDAGRSKSARASTKKPRASTKKPRASTTKKPRASTTQTAGSTKTVGRAKDAGRAKNAGRAKPDPTGELASIIRDGLDIWVAQARRWYERSSDRATWSPEDVVGDYTNLIENLTPLAERSIDLTVELLRPWAQRIESLR